MSDIYEIGRDGGFDLSVPVEEHNQSASQSRKREQMNYDRQKKQSVNNTYSRGGINNRQRPVIDLTNTQINNQNDVGFLAKNMTIIIAALAYTFGYEMLAFSLLMLFFVNKILSS